MPRNNDHGWWRVARDEADAIDIDIYGDIGERRDWWTGEMEGIGAKAFLDTLRAARGKAVNLHVNSGGGSVTDAYAMMTAIRNHDAKVTAYIDGLAASAASFLVAAADEVVMSSVAWMMIHKASIVAWGNADELRAEVEYLEKIDAQLAGIYARRSGTRGEDEFAGAMAETTWFTADEAVEWGLADRVEEAVAAAACFTMDRATLDSAPRDAWFSLNDDSTGLLLRGKPGAYVTGTTDTALAVLPGDTSENMDPSGDSTAEPEPAGAEARVVAIGNRVLRIRTRTEERGKNA